MKIPHATIITCLLLTSCATPNRPYWVYEEWKDGRKLSALNERPRNTRQTGPREDYPYAESNATRHVLIPTAETAPYQFRVIEFDEQGDYWAYQEVMSARKMIETSEKAPLMVLFIHGWHNNADPDQKDRDLDTFEELLRKLAINPSVRAKHSVCGVYIGWRGLSQSHNWDYTGVGWIARHLGFFSRKEATDRMAGVPLTRVLLSLVKACKAQNGARAILVGHSFGGRILEKAVAQAILGHAMGSERRTGSRRFADMILLINSASEALTARELKLALDPWPADEPPAIISVTSEGDSATAVAWPVANGISSALAFNGFRTYADAGHGTRQKSYITSTAGHNGFVRDLAASNLTSVVRMAGDLNDSFGHNLIHGTTNSFRIGNGAAAQMWGLFPNTEQEFNMTQCTGYLTISVPDVILKGHGGDPKTGGIFSGNTMDLFAMLYNHCRGTNAPIGSE